MTSSKQLQSKISNQFDESVLVNALKEIYNLENVVIEDVEFQAGNKKGDSYMSTINKFTVKVTGKQKSNGDDVDLTLPIIAKSLPKVIGWRKSFRSADFFSNECMFYNIVWKAMDQFQLEKNVKVFHEIPLCISAYADGVNDYIALENLNPKGFEQLTRCYGVDFNHAQLIMQLFARFHALGLAFKDQKPKEFEKIANSLEETYYSEKCRSWYATYQVNNLIPVVWECIKCHLPESYLTRFKENVIDIDFYGKLAKLCEEKGPLSVITHGDAWAPNFLFKYAEKDNLVDAVMLDFQLARYASIAFDITFFLYSCTDQSLRQQYWDVLIEDYHTTFVATLNRLGSSPDLLTLDRLKSEIKSYALFGVGISMEGIAMSLLEDEDVVDLEGIEDEEVRLENVWIIPFYKDEKKQQRFADMIKHAIDNGFM